MIGQSPDNRYPSLPEGTSGSENALGQFAQAMERLKKELEGVVAMSAQIGEADRLIIARAYLLAEGIIDAGGHYTDDEIFGHAFARMRQEAGELQQRLLEEASKRNFTFEQMRQYFNQVVGLALKEEQEESGDRVGDDDEVLEGVFRETSDFDTTSNNRPADQYSTERHPDAERLAQLLRQLLQDSQTALAVNIENLGKYWDQDVGGLQSQILRADRERATLRRTLLTIENKAMGVRDSEYELILQSVRYTLELIEESIEELKTMLATLTGEEEEKLKSNPFRATIENIRARIDTANKFVGANEVRNWQPADINELRVVVSQITHLLSELGVDVRQLITRIELATQINDVVRTQNITTLGRLNDVVTDLDRGLQRLRATLTDLEKAVAPPTPPDRHALDAETKNLDQQLSSIVAKQYYVINEINNNPLTIDFQKAEELLDELRRKGASHQELADYEHKILTLRFKITKVTIIKNIERFEENEDSAEALDGYNNTVLKNLFVDLETICRRVQPQYRDRFLAEKERFEKNEYVHILVFYSASKSLRNEALGIAPNGKERTMMQLPTSFPVFWNSMSNEKINNFFKPHGISVCTDPELKGDEKLEIEVNPVIGTRRVRVLDPENERYVEKTVEITAIGQTMRWLDLLFSGHVPDFEPQRFDVAGLTKSELHEWITNLENTRLINEYKDAHGGRSPRPDDERYKSKITEQHVRRAFNMFIMLYRHFYLAPGSFSQPAPGYYALQPDYTLSEIKGQTGAQSSLIAFLLFGYSSAGLVSEDNPDGVLYAFDHMMPTRKVEGLAARIAAFTRPETKTSIREAMEHNFKHHHVDERWWFLMDLPLLPLTARKFRPDKKKNEQEGVGHYLNHYMLFTTPLENIVLRGRAGQPLHAPDTTVSGRLDFGNLDNRFMTAEDMVDLKSIWDGTPEQARAFYVKHGYIPSMNGDLMWEELGLGDEDETARIKWWINQAKNIVDFNDDIFSTSATKLMSKTEAEIMNAFDKRIKYAISLLHPFCFDVRYVDKNEHDPAKIFDAVKFKIIFTIMFIQGLLMMKAGKGFHEVKMQMNNYKIVDNHGIEAVLVALESGFGAAATIDEIIDKFVDQVLSSLKYSKGH